MWAVLNYPQTVTIQNYGEYEGQSLSVAVRRGNLSSETMGSLFEVGQDGKATIGKGLLKCEAGFLAVFDDETIYWQGQLPPGPSFTLTTSFANGTPNLPRNSNPEPDATKNP